MSEANPNMQLWEKLGRTDPKHTKAFTRGGGFKGTAIKPIYTTQKMTEVFGPAGAGWGMGEPKFQIVPGSDGQVAVFCTVMVWWRDGDELNQVYGVGGDMVVIKQSSGLRTDDEAFKKAFTDAVGNGMKHLGMSADVHMGLFDDSKYVREVAAEIAAHEREPDTIESNATAKQHFKTIYDDITKCTTLKQLKGAWERHQPVFKLLPPAQQEDLIARKDEMKDFLAEQEAAAKDGSKPVTTYNFDQIEQGAL